MRIEDTIHIDAPVSRVWEVTLDIEALPSHTTTFTDIKRLDAGPLQVGSTARIKQPGQPARVWTVTVLEAERQFAWTTTMLGMTFTGDHLMEAAESDASVSTLAIDIAGALAPVLGPLLKRQLRKAISTENQGIAAAAEA